MQKDVFDALGMKNTVAEHVNEDIPNLTKFYLNPQGEVQPAPFVDNSYKWAGGGFVGTTEDLCIFGQAHMKAGFLKQSVLDEWMTSQKTADGKDTKLWHGLENFQKTKWKNILRTQWRFSRWELLTSLFIKSRKLLWQLLPM